MKINNFRGDLTDNSAEKEALMQIKRATTNPRITNTLFAKGLDVGIRDTVWPDSAKLFRNPPGIDR